MNDVDRRVVHNKDVDSRQPLVGAPEPEPPGDQARTRGIVLVVAVGLAAGLFAFLFGATTGGVDDGVVVCRPDQYLVLRIHGASALTDGVVDAFDIVPIEIGERYAAETEANLGGICCSDFGPIRMGDLVVTANRYTSGTITAWEQTTLVPHWSTRIGETSLLFGSAGDLILATPGSDRLVALDAATGASAWEAPLPERYTVVSAAPDLGRNVWYVTADQQTEGATAAPRVLAVDLRDGAILWTATGEPVTQLQWADPAVFDDVVVIMDVPRFTIDGTSPETAHLIGFDVDTGDRRWITALNSPTEGFSDRLLVSDPERSLLIASTPYGAGAVFSVDPATGDVRWRTETGFARIVDIEADVVVLQGAGEIRLDLSTGAFLDGDVATVPVVSLLAIEQPVPLRILTVRSSTMAVLDLETATTTLYPPGSHALQCCTLSGAVMTPRRELILWTYEPAARVFSGPLNRVDLELRPIPLRIVDGFASALRVVPTPAGDSLWLVQPGIGYAQFDYPTLIELIELPTGRRLGRFEADSDSFPVAATDTGLVLNTERLFDTGDGWITEPGTERVLLLQKDGTTTDIGAGRAIAATSTRIVRIECPHNDRGCELRITGIDGTDLGTVPKPSNGVWTPVGGPSIPSDAMPLQTVSPDGSSLLVALRENPDVNGTPTRSTLHVVNLTDQTTRQVASFEQRGYPLATWSADGHWIAVIDNDSVLLIDSTDPESTLTLEGVIPAKHYPLAAG